jgi:hypothetical protein
MRNWISFNSAHTGDYPAAPVGSGLWLNILGGRPGGLSGVPSGSRSLALVHMGHIWVFPPDQGELEGGITYTYNMRNARGRGVWPPPNSKENPDSQKSSPMELLILKKCSFASSFVSLLIDTYPAAGCCSLFWADMSTVLGAWVLVNAKALGPQEGL